MGVTKEFGINVVENCENCCRKPCDSGAKVVSVIASKNNLRETPKSICAICQSYLVNLETFRDINLLMKWWENIEEDIGNHEIFQGINSKGTFGMISAKLITFMAYVRNPFIPKSFYAQTHLLFTTEQMNIAFMTGKHIF